MLLDGLKVLDVGHYVAGPFCTRQMALLGADVIKIEKPCDDILHLRESGLFLYLNANKKSVTLDLRTHTGVEIFKKLIKSADIIVENFEPSVMPSWGLSYEVLEEINPRLVVTSISNFGQSGAYKDYEAVDMTIWGMSGLMGIHGDDNKPPLHVGGYIVSYIGGYMGFLGSLAGLYHAEMTREGQHVDVSLLECCLLCHPQTLVQYAYARKMSPEFGRGKSAFAAIYPCKDGFVWVTLTEPKWPNFTRFLNMPELEKDPRFDFTDEEKRRRNISELEKIILPFILKHTKEELVSMAKSADVPLVAQRNVGEVLGNSQYKARGFFREVVHALYGTLIYPMLPFESTSCEPILAPAPLLGQHNEEVYGRRLGFSKEELTRLSREGVI